MQNAMRVDPAIFTLVKLSCETQPSMDKYPIYKIVAIVQVASKYWKWDKFWLERICIYLPLLGFGQGDCMAYGHDPY